MKKTLISFLTGALLFTLFIPTAFAIPISYSADVVTVNIEAEFVQDGLLIKWDSPTESDLQYYDLYYSTEVSQMEIATTPQETLFSSFDETPDNIDDKLAYIHTTPPSGVGYYRMCVYTILSTYGCGDVLSIHGDRQIVLYSLVDSFPDISGHWGEKYIEKLRSLSVVEGRDGDFEPDNNILRAEAIKIMMLAFNIGGTSCHGDLYPDVNHGDWFCDVISKATQEGYTEGDQDMMYPGREITRAEAVKVVLEIKGVSVPSVSIAPFEDVDLDQWYAKYVAKAKELGIVQGLGDGTFEPNRSITRAELSKIAVEAAEL